jgi:integrase/recombinase XerD
MKQAKVLNEKEMKRVMSVVRSRRHSKRDELVVLLSFYAGMRSCEISSLRIGDVVDEEGNAKDTLYLNSWQTKGSERQSVMIGERLQKAITKYVVSERQHSDAKAPLILSQKGKAFSSASLQNLFRDIYEGAGIDGASSHSGRRTYITTLSEKGVSARVIQQLARHSSLATTQRYIEVNDAVMRKAVELVG